MEHPRESWKGIATEETMTELVNTILNTGSDAGLNITVIDSGGNPVFNADLIDTTSSTVIYEGFRNNVGSYRVCKIDLSTPIISKMWATGDWDDRALLLYV